MAICSNCGREFNPKEDEREYKRNPYIRRNGLGYTYVSFNNTCANCAIQVVYDSYPQGLEDMSYHLWDDDD